MVPLGMADFKLAARVRYRTRQRISRIPWLYCPLARMRRPQHFINRHSDIVIEGFPRSGNTFATQAFRLSQPRPMTVASHMHVPIQVSLAVRWGIPCILLVREPEAAVVSYVLFHPHLTVNEALFEYSRFYRELSPHIDGVVVADFSLVTSDFGAVVDRVNEKFSRTFHRFVHSPENVNRCFDGMEHRMRARGKFDENRVGRPSEAREQKKVKVREELQGPESEESLREAKNVYQWLLGLAE